MTPEAHGEHLPILLAQVFIPQQVRATPPPVELPRELWRRLLAAGDLAPTTCPRTWIGSCWPGSARPTLPSPRNRSCRSSPTPTSG